VKSWLSGAKPLGGSLHFLVVVLNQASFFGSELKTNPRAIYNSRIFGRKMIEDILFRRTLWII
jgi:hypothetical protein